MCCPRESELMSDILREGQSRGTEIGMRNRVSSQPFQIIGDPEKKKLNLVIS